MDRLLTLEKALAERVSLFDPAHETAIRLLNGFLEGWPELVVEVYGRTLVLINHAKNGDLNPTPNEIAHFYRECLPWIDSVLVKERYGNDEAGRNGKLIAGEKAVRAIREHGVRYALDLTLNQDTSFYIDTRNLRKWAVDNLVGKRVLNTFAYTGSLGVAAMAAGASRVVHVDLSRAFLNLAKTSYTLNGFPIDKRDFQARDFFQAVGAFKRENSLFDCVFLDPPYFSTTSSGRVDMVGESATLINKVRPLIADGGWLVAINNALFVSGAEYLQTLENLCSDGYLTIEALIPIPDDCIGYTETIQRTLPADPAPFNHATKIVMLRVRRKHVK